jgi:hypothetical protein
MDASKPARVRGGNREGTEMNSQPITRLRRKMLLLANMLAGNVDPDRVARLSRLLRSTLSKISDMQNA